MTAPDFMPVLSAGGHTDPKQGACVMEYVSILAGEPFSDRPSCTHRDIASVAITLNDSTSNDKRHLLVPLIPRLIGTSGYSCEKVDAFRQRISEKVRALSPRLCNCLDCALFSYITSATTTADQVARFTDALDEFDRITGHKPTGIAPAEMAAAVALVKQS